MQSQKYINFHPWLQNSAPTRLFAHPEQREPNLEKVTTMHMHGLPSLLWCLKDACWARCRAHARFHAILVRIRDSPLKESLHLFFVSNFMSVLRSLHDKKRKSPEIYLSFVSHGSVIVKHLCHFLSVFFFASINDKNFDGSKILPGCGFHPSSSCGFISQRCFDILPVSKVLQHAGCCHKLLSKAEELQWLGQCLFVDALQSFLLLQWPLI